MNTLVIGDPVSLSASVINVYDNGTVRIQVQPSGRCYDVPASDLTLLPTLTASVATVAKES